MTEEIEIKILEPDKNREEDFENRTVPEQVLFLLNESGGNLDLVFNRFGKHINLLTSGPDKIFFIDSEDVLVRRKKTSWRIKRAKSSVPPSTPSPSAREQLQKMAEETGEISHKVDAAKAEIQKRARDLEKEIFGTPEEKKMVIRTPEKVGQGVVSELDPKKKPKIVEVEK